MTLPVGIIGLGNAGSALATALSGKLPLYGYDINQERHQVVSHLPIEFTDSIVALGSQVSSVVLSLPKPEISRATVAELLAGRSVPDLIIETSTITPKVAQELDKMCQARKVSFVDAAIAGGVAGMAAGSTTFLVGGTEANYAKAHPVLDAMSETVMHLGPVGTGMGTKVVINAVLHALMVVLIEAGAMASKQGIPMQTLIDILRREEGLLRPLTHRVQERILAADYQGGMSVSNARKDSVLALEMAQELGVPLYAIQASHTPYEIAASSGMGDLDYAALATLWETWAEVKFSNSTCT
ncbi:MAG: NAD(P)-dependent oxidoreductase [bacterium]|nr:NAD(P)-dependent oxidoreductase [bacterium]